MTDELLKWIEDNTLDVQVVETDIEGVEMYQIAEIGTFFFVIGQEQGLIHTDGTFFLTDDEQLILYHLKPDYLLFEFGQRFYFCKPLANDVGDYMVGFNDFRYLGKSMDVSAIPFVHLGVHTEYELLNGSQSAALYCKKAKFLGMEAVGICDKNTLAGTLPLQFACEKEGLRSILGETVVVAYDYDAAKEHQITFELKLYVVNKIGWKNLLNINKAINVDFDGFVPENLLLERAEGLICVLSTNCFLNSDYYDDYTNERRVKEYKRQFDLVYYQFDTVEFDDDAVDLNHLENLNNYFLKYQKLVPEILINDSYYCDQDMFLVKDWLNKIGGKISDYSEDQYFKTISNSFAKFAPLFTNLDQYAGWFQIVAGTTAELLQACDFKIPTSPPKLPRYEFAEGMTNEELFYGLIEKGFLKKIAGKVADENEYLERIEKEVEVIVSAKLVDYFLIIWDIIKYATDRGILVGTGRGSIGGSLVAYLLNLTEIDPIKFDLLFERFLNATRAAGSLPDVDTDFPAEYRDEIKDYISKRFGVMHVCSIGSYTRLKLKAGLKDFGRVKGLKFSYVNFITNDIDHQLEYTFTDFVRFAIQSKELRNFFQRNPDVIHCVKDALQQCRAASIHASGVVIVPKQDFEGNDVDIFDWLPIRKIAGKLVSEWEGKYIEKAGYLKEDILGLNQLDKFKTILNLIRKNYKKRVILEKIPLDDEKTFRLFQRGFNEDVFQFTSGGLKQYSKQVKPDHIEDLVAMNALYRPGPMGSKAHDAFAMIKHGRQKPKYDYGLKSVTEKTFGVYVYQEQIMKAVVVLGGMSPVESDTFRAAIKKFDHKTMAAYEEKFVTGAIKNGCPAKEAKFIWTKLLKFSGYGFNKSHSAAYTVMGYQSQWLKVHFPLEFWTASIQHAKEFAVSNRISEMRKVNKEIKLRLPDINESEIHFTCDPEKQHIYWSLVKIYGTGTKTALKILRERQSGGKFVSFEDYVGRTGTSKTINKNLILCGAFDTVEGLRTPMERINVLKKWEEIYGEKLEPEYNSFKAKTMPFWILKAKYLTGLGDIPYDSFIAEKDRSMARKYLEPDKFFKTKTWTEGVVAGVVTYATEKTGKKAGKYFDLRLDCNNEEIMVTFWTEQYELFKEQLHSIKGELVAISGKVMTNRYFNSNVMYPTDDTKILKL